MHRVTAAILAIGCGGGSGSSPGDSPDAGSSSEVCTPGQTRSCYAGDPTQVGVGRCQAGTQRCLPGADEFGTWAPCAGAVGPEAETCNVQDDDCNGTVDDVAGGCTVTVKIDLDGDCLEVLCPDDAPYVLGCNVMFEGGDPRGCVAIIDMGGGLYFQEGNNCDAGHLSGTMTCGSEPGAPLSPAACPINKDEQLYVPSPDLCPDTT